MERLLFGNNKYVAIEAAIHVNRYLAAKSVCKDKKVLDLACGEGYGSFLLSEWGAKEVIGVDISKESINNANKNFKKDNIKFLVSDAEKLSTLEDKSFDLIVSFETIEHLKNPDLFLKEIKRLIKPNGIIIMSCPNDYFYYPLENEKNEYHLRKYSFEEYKELSEKHLGKAKKFMFGVYLGGYINTFSETNDNNFTQDKMLNNYPINTIKVSSDSKILENDSCYYLGFWNYEPIESATIYPYEYNELLKDINKINSYSQTIEQKNTELYKKIEELHKSNDLIKENELKLTKENEELNKKINEDNKLKNRNSLLIELLNEEKKILLGNIYELQLYSTSLENKNNEIFNQSIENQRHLESILYSRTYKVANFFSKIIRKIKFW